DAQLERVRGDDAEHLARTEAALDGPPLGGEVAAPVAAHPLPRPPSLAERLTQDRQDELDLEARAAEDDGLAVRAEEGERDPGRHARRRRAHPELGIDDRRVDHRDGSCPRWRAV